ncbi:MAG TPA: outer membrane beta-barrel protein [Phenylobacterium sp.]
MSVRERARPQYEAVGARVGAFKIYPSVDASLEYNDNVFARDTQTVDDLLVRLTPELDVQSDWSRHMLAAFARARLERYSNYSSENTDDWAIGVNGVLEINRAAALSAELEASHRSEARTAARTPSRSAERVEYDETRAEFGARWTGPRVKLEGDAAWSTFDYGDVLARPGVTIDQDFRDHEVFGVRGRASLAVSPRIAAYGEVRADEREFDEAPERDSTGYEALVGLDVDLTRLIRGELAVGYVNRDYVDIGGVDGLALRGQLEWFPTGLTTVTGIVTRTVEEAGVVGAPAVLATNFDLRLDHELLRNLILTGELGFYNDDFQGGSRADRRSRYATSATWFLNRRVGLNFGIEQIRQESTGLNAAEDYRVNRVLVGTVLQF